MKTLILASSSPRRKALLKQANLTFTVLPSHMKESIAPYSSPQDAVKSLARKKAMDIFQQHPDNVILAADTVVVFQGKILGKPADEQEAYEMLERLSGRQHDVFTGVAIVSADAEIVFYDATRVTFWDLEREDIERYVASGEPFDKAGAYGIQGLGAIFVKEIQGDFYNVVGLPLSRTVRQLKSLGMA